MLTRKLFPRWFHMTMNTHRQHDRKLRGAAGNMSYDDIWLLFNLQGGRCKQTGIPMYLGESNQFNAYKCSIDRLDNSRPHDWDNIQLVVRTYNTCKAGRLDYNMSEFVLTLMRDGYRVRPLDKYLLNGVL